MMKTSRHQHGFTLIEMMITVAVLTLVMGTVVAYISRLQRVYKTQETSVDSTDESRMFLDNIERELHQSGYPSKNMYTKGLLLLTPPENNTVVAYGLVSISKWNIYFEGDFDNDGVVEDIRYTLLDSNGAIATGASTCPCTLQRALKTKIAGAPGTTITDADVLNANLATAALNNVINSGDGAGNALTITGTTGFAGGSTSNNVLYASYKTPMIFTGYDNAGNVSTNVAQIRSIEIAVNLLTNYSDTQTNMRPPLTMRTTVKLNNF